MRPVTSPNTFKTCYIAQVKEELGFPIRMATNRKGVNRKILVPDYLRPFIKSAIEALTKKGKPITYKDIQAEAFAIYSSGNSQSDRYFGAYKVGNVCPEAPTEALIETFDEFVKSVVENEEIYYAL